MMDQAERFDAIIVGAGQGGGPIASALARAGKKTAIIENGAVGGTCINVGCTPTKTMIASAREAYLARRGPDYGVHTDAVSVDMEKVRQRKRDIVESFRSGSERNIANSAGLELIRGTATFTGERQFRVTLNAGGERTLASDIIVLDTGARPSIPQIEGLDSVPFLDSTSIMELDTVPEHLIVIGGGYVGIEFGQMFLRFGSQVTMLQRGGSLLQREDGDIAGAVLDILRADGVEVMLNTTPVRVAREGGGIVVTARGGDGERTVRGTHLLIAAGRKPNTESLDPQAGGLQTDEKGAIPVNERLETNVPGVYAIGDMNGGPAFTHISYNDYIILKRNLLDGGHETTTGRLVPYTVFMDPQLGAVGLRERDARKQGIRYQVAKMPMTSVARAIETDEQRGFMKALVDPETERILGCAVLGLDGGEIMAMLQIAMMGNLPYTALRDGVFAHPTLAESVNNLFMTLGEP